MRKPNPFINIYLSHILKHNLQLLNWNNITAAAKWASIHAEYKF